MHIITVQHTEAVHHKNGMVGGSADWPLTKRGEWQARRIAKALRRELGAKPDYVLYASDMLRTTQTAAPISRALGLPIQYVPELREIKVGSAAGQSKAWLKEHQAPREGVPFLDYRPLPDAETWREMSGRVARFTERLEAAGENAIVVAHGGSLGCFVQCFLQVPKDHSEHIWFHGSAGGVHRLEKQLVENGRALYILHKFNEIPFERRP